MKKSFMSWAIPVCAASLMSACALSPVTTPAVAENAVAKKVDAPRVAPRVAPKAWAPTEYPISFWEGVPPEALTRARFQEVKDAGFTYVNPPINFGDTPEYNRKALDLCRQVGLKAFIIDKRIPMSLSDPGAKEKIDAVISDYRNYPALAGYHLTDEPGAGKFAGLAEVVSYMREKDPRHPVFINLFPNYAPPRALGTPTYDEYLRQFAQQVKPFALSYDHYHFLTSGGKNVDRGTFFPNLASARKVAAEFKIPFWQIVLVTQHAPATNPTEGYRNLTEGELRYEAMQTLAYGGKGLMWFTYWVPRYDANFIWQNAMINADGTRNPHYYMVQRVNSELRALGKQLLNATSTSVFHDGTIPTGGAPRTNEPIRAAGKGDFTIGMFQGRGKTLALIANADYSNTVTSEFLVSTSRSKLQQFNPHTRQWSFVSGAAARGDGDILVSLKLSPGGAALLRW